MIETEAKNNNDDIIENYNIFKMLLKKFKVVAMIKNLLNWFSKSNDNVFYINRVNPFMIDISSPYLKLFGLEYNILSDHIAVWI